MEDLHANPAPLGYFALGIALITVGLSQASFFESGALGSVVAVVAAVSMVVAGLLGYHARSTFGFAAFSLLGMFWFSMAALWILDEIDHSLVSDRQYIAWYLAVWTLLGGILFVASRRRAFAIQVVFAILTVWFGLFAISEFTGSEVALQMAGFEGLITGAVSVYLAGALLINETAKRNLLPIGEPFMSTIIIPDDISQLFD